MCIPWKTETWCGGQKGLKDRPSDTVFFTAALPGEELLCCVCRSETVVPGNRLVSCEKCRHGESGTPEWSSLPWAFQAASHPSL